MEICQLRLTFSGGIIYISVLNDIKYLIEEAFVTNDLFYEFGDIKERRNLVLKYMEAYAKMYQHLGCKLYNTKTALNGVTRYNLVWKGYDELYE